MLYKYIKGNHAVAGRSFRIPGETFETEIKLDKIHPGDFELVNVIDVDVEEEDEDEDEDVDVDVDDVDVDEEEDEEEDEDELDEDSDEEEEENDDEEEDIAQYLTPVHRGRGKYSVKDSRTDTLMFRGQTFSKKVATEVAETGQLPE